MTYYFQAKQLCVGYQNQPLIQNIEIELKKGGNPDADRSKRCRKIHHFKKHCASAGAFGRQCPFGG